MNMRGLYMWSWPIRNELYHQAQTIDLPLIWRVMVDQRKCWVDSRRSHSFSICVVYPLINLRALSWYKRRQKVACKKVNCRTQWWPNLINQSIYRKGLHLSTFSDKIILTKTEFRKSIIPPKFRHNSISYKGSRQNNEIYYKESIYYLVILAKSLGSNKLLSVLQLHHWALISYSLYYGYIIERW